MYIFQINEWREKDVIKCEGKNWAWKKYVPLFLCSSNFLHARCISKWNLIWYFVMHACASFLLIMTLIKFSPMPLMPCPLIKTITHSGMSSNADNYSLVTSYLHGLYLNSNSPRHLFHFHSSDSWLVTEKWIVCKVPLLPCRSE